MRLLLVGVVLLTWLPVSITENDKLRFTVGCMFPDGGVRSAFGYQIMKNNNDRNSRIRIEAKKEAIDKLDSYTFVTRLCSLMRHGIFSLYGMHNMRIIHTVKSFTSTFHMPYLTSSMAVNYTGQDSGYDIYMRPYYAKALVQLIQHLGWDALIFVYNEDEGMYRLEQLQNALFEEGMRLKIDVHRVTGVSNAKELIWNMSARDDEVLKRILIDLPTDDTQEILTYMVKVPKRSQFHFLLGGLDVNQMTLTEYKSGGLNITGLRIVDFNNETVKQFIKNGWADLAKNIWPGAGVNSITYEEALTVDGVILMVKTFKRMMQRDPHVFRNTIRGGTIYNNGTVGVECNADPLIPWYHGPEMIRTMKHQIEFQGLTGKVAFDKFGLRRDFVLDVIEFGEHRGMAKSGYWDSSRGLFMHSPQMLRIIKGQERISNKTRIITSILTAPFLMYKKNHEQLKGNDRFEGFAAALARHVADYIKFDYEIKVVPDDQYGSLTEPNKTWNGMVGELVYNRADLAIAPLTITAVREKVIDFSKPFMSLGISIMIKKPNDDKPGVFSFMYPLSGEIWMCVIFAYIGVSVVLFLVSRFSPFEWHIEDSTEGPSVSNNFTISNSLWFGVGAFMQQGCDIEPRSMSGRIVGSVWWFFTLIIISSYTANLAAFLTVERMNTPIESAEDLAKQTDIKYGSLGGGSTLEFFKTSSIPVYKRMWTFMSSTRPSVFVAGNEEGVERVRKSNGKYAFLMESTVNDYTNERLPCDTMKVGSNLDSKGYGIGTPLGSDLRSRVTLAVLTLRENGVLHDLKTEWWFKRGQCGTQKVKQKDATNALKLSNVAGIFYILIGGLAAALLSATLEFIYKAHMEAHRRKTAFSSVLCSRTRLAVRGSPDSPTAKYAGMNNDKKSLSTYTYSPAAQLVTADGYADNTHTQV